MSKALIGTSVAPYQLQYVMFFRLEWAQRSSFLGYHFYYYCPSSLSIPSVALWWLCINESRYRCLETRSTWTISVVSSERCVVCFVYVHVCCPSSVTCLILQLNLFFSYCSDYQFIQYQAWNVPKIPSVQRSFGEICITVPSKKRKSLSVSCAIIPAKDLLVETP